MNEKKITVLIVDDSALMRRELRRMLETDPSIEVIGAARNGTEGVELTKKHRPDVVTMDINMPEMDGLSALQMIMLESPRPVIMVSSLTQEGEKTTYEALELGAVDFIGKPGGTVSINIKDIEKDLIYKVKAAAGSNLLSGRAARLRRRQAMKSQPEKPRHGTPSKNDIGKIVVIGQSTGGPNTIFDIIPHLPNDLGVPFIIVQHMPGSFTPGFAKRISDSCSFPFKEAARGDIILPNHGYLAPGDIHMTLGRRGGGQPGQIVRLSTQPTNTAHTPSVDVTMDSILEIYGKNMIGVILTGMGSDGADAMVKIRNAGGRTIAEAEETCVVYGMPKEAARRGGAEFVLPSYKIADKIIELLRRG